MSEKKRAAEQVETPRTTVPVQPEAAVPVQPEASVPAQPEAPRREQPIAIPAQEVPQHDRTRPRISDSTRALATTATVLAVVAAAVTLYVNDTTVTVIEDGQPKQVRFLGNSVAGALSAAGVVAEKGDYITPKREGNIRDGGIVTITHRRPITVTIGPVTSRHWVTKTTVGASLDHLGIHASDSALDKPRSTRIPREGISITMSTPISVDVIADGASLQWATSSQKVSGVLRERGIRLRTHDIVYPGLDSKPVDGGEIRVVRVEKREMSRIETIAVPAEPKYVSDSSLKEGQTQVVSAGIPGHRRITERITTHDGVAVQTEQLSAETLKQPTPKVIRYGGAEIPQTD